MKKGFYAFALCFLILLSYVPVLADVELSYNPILTDQSLLNPIQQTEYANWKPYQPISSEIAGEDMTKDSHFQDRRFFPVVAVKDNRAILILLYREGESWSVSGITETALNRPGLILEDFTIDANNRPDDTALSIYFGFRDNEQAHYQLGLTATDVYTTRFDFLSFTSLTGSTLKKAEHLFADIFILGFNSGFIFEYVYHDPYMEQSYSMDVISGESDYDNFTTFDLGRVPWSLLDAMEECTAYSDSSINEGRILLKQFNSHDAATLCEISEGARLLREVNSLNFASRDWVLVVYGYTVGYLPKSNILLPSWGFFRRHILVGRTPGLGILLPGIPVR